MTSLVGLLARGGPARWALSHQWIRRWLDEFGIRPLSHSSLIWLRETGEHHTRVTLRNYFSLNYGIPEPEYRFRLHDGDGQCVADWRRVAHQDETLIIDSEDLVSRFGLGCEFEGTLVTEVRHPALDPPRFLRANVDYYSDDGQITTVHEQGRLVQTPRPDAQSVVYVREDEGY